MTVEKNNLYSEDQIQETVAILERAKSARVDRPSLVAELEDLFHATGHQFRDPESSKIWKKFAADRFRPNEAFRVLDEMLASEDPFSVDCDFRTLLRLKQAIADHVAPKISRSGKRLFAWSDLSQQEQRHARSAIESLRSEVDEQRTKHRPR